MTSRVLFSLLAVLAMTTLACPPSKPWPPDMAGDGPTSDARRHDGLPGDRSRLDVGGRDTRVPDVTARSDMGVANSWVRIPRAGTPVPVTFTMGSPSSDLCRGDDETPHQVTLTRAFEMQATELTQAQYQALMNDTPSTFFNCGATCPVENLSWGKAAEYCNRLSAREKYEACYAACDATGCWDNAPAYYTTWTTIHDCPGYRLPTEAEWEYAYRAKTTTAYYSGPNDSTRCDECSPAAKDANLDAIGWYCGNAGSTTHAVGQKQANAWGLHDMAGNVWEWCHDWYRVDLGSTAVTDPEGADSPNRKKAVVIRGGSYSSAPSVARASDRVSFNWKWPSNDVGFRCVRTLQP